MSVFSDTDAFEIQFLVQDSQNLGFVYSFYEV